MRRFFQADPAFATMHYTIKEGADLTIRAVEFIQLEGGVPFFPAASAHVTGHDLVVDGGYALW